MGGFPGHTHTQTHHEGIYRASIASQGKNGRSLQCMELNREELTYEAILL